MRVVEVSPEDWPDVGARFADFTFEQSVTYLQAAARRIGAELKLLSVVDEAGEVHAAAGVRIKRVPILKRGIAWCPAGPMLLRRGDEELCAERAKAVLTALKSELVDKGGHVFRFRPAGIALKTGSLMQSAASELGFHRTDLALHYQSIAISLDNDDETLMQNFAGRWRTDLRYALKSDLTLVTGTAPDIRARFLSMYDEVREEKGFRPNILPEFHFDLSGPDFQWQVLIAEKDGLDLGGIVVGFTGRCAVYLFGATARPGRKLRAGYFLAWEAIRLAREKGMDWYDLGGIDEVSNPTVTRFKRRTNGVDLDVEPFESRPSGLSGKVIEIAERIRARIV